MKSVSVYLIITIIVVWNISQTHSFWQYFEWTGKYNNNRTNLFCPLYCKDQTDEHAESCCCCNSKTLWELDTRRLLTLETEYTGRRGKAIILPKPSVKVGYTQFIKVVHVSGFLVFMPLNMCSYSDIVEINFSKNAFKGIGDISCLSNLDTLDLSHNLITFISNSSFSGLSLLRRIDLSYNLIRRIEPYTLFQKSLELFSVDFSHNEIRDLDCTNIVKEKTFCKIKYDHNKIDRLVNEASFQIDKNKTYGGGGYIDLSHNNLKHFINFTDLGISDLTLLGKFFNFAFDLRNSHIHCDCNMEPYLQKARQWVNRMWRDYFNITCDFPPNLVGLTIGEVVARNKSGLDRLTCDISSSSDGCPTVCTCYRQPSQERTVVDCNSAGLLHLPKHMPPFNDLQLFFANNSIKELDLDSVSYLSRISHLDLSGNLIEKISETFAKALNKNISIVLQGNNLKNIPSSFKSNDPCNLHLGYVYIPCNCDNEWVSDWLSVRRENTCTNKSNILCTTQSGHVPALEFDFQSLNCRQDHVLRNIALSVAIVTLLLVGGLAICYYYRYEIYLLRKNPRNPRKNRLQYRTDVYITVGEDDEEQLLWVVNVLLPFLNARNYSVFFPLRDSDVGRVREEEIINSVGNSRNYIVLLSWNSLGNGSDEAWQNLEWRYIWNNFKRQPHLKNIIIINYAQFRSCDFVPSPIKAFLRLKLTLDFANRKHQLLRDVQMRLGTANELVCTKPLNYSKPNLYQRISNTILPDNGMGSANNRSSTSSPFDMMDLSSYTNNAQMYSTDGDKSSTSARKSNISFTGIDSLSHHRKPKTINISI